jgi:methyl-accepting chemotaxis protein-2 (aspartate sensor receptor)
LATLFGKQYMTQYDPVRNAAGQVVGVLYVGVDIDAEIAALKERIRAVKLGDTGYFYVLDARPGKDFGRMLVHPSLEGKNMLAVKAADGREVFREILERKQGEDRYPWQEKEGAAAKEQFAAFAHEKSWNWVVVGSAYVDDMTREVKALRNRYALFGIAAVLVLVGLLYFFIRRAVTLPLARATAAAQRLATGDLTATLQTSRSDEIGQLMQAMNGTGQGLTDVVRQVRAGAGQIAAASGEIAAGNLDLSERTERQAGSLRDTAAAMNQLTATVQQNSSDADQAQRLAASAADVAARGGVAVGEVVQTMEEISQASRRMADIISVIDGIAFQTNILALNAAVEAARAGEQGRGFAVVAGEVRVLAQRSAAAAQEIKALIDASAGKVEAGGIQVRRAGATMEEVVSGVQELSALMAGISQASRHQSEDIAKVDGMVSQMDEVTQQNAAMVEQAAAAAASLQEQAATLVGMVDTFKVA